LWSKADESRRPHEQYKSLKLRRPKIADKDPVPVSPDVLAIEELIREHGESDVKIAWACFSSNPAPHCKPPDAGDQATMYPVTVFLKHYDSFAGDAKADLKTYQEERNGRQLYPDSIWLIIKYNTEFPRQA
jgi:hypothetical protein